MSIKPSRRSKRRLPVLLVLVGTVACGDQHAITESSAVGDDGTTNPREHALAGPFLYFPLDVDRSVSGYRYGDWTPWGIHTAWDLGANLNEPVRAAAAGALRILSSDPNFLCGLSVLVYHPNGFVTKYCHFNQIVGGPREVQVGEIIGLAGATGVGSGVHLHFSVGNGGVCSNDNPTGTCVDPGFPSSATPSGLWVGRFAYLGEVSPVGAPNNLGLSVSAGRVNLSWSPGANADHYRVFRGTSSGQESYFSWTRELSFTDAPPPGQRFFYFVRSVSSDGRESGNSNEVSGLALSPPSLSAGVSYGRINLTWFGAAGADHYRIFRGTSAGGEAYLGYTHGTTFSDASIVLGQRYFYVVRSVSSSGEESANSNEVSATANPKRRSPCYSGKVGDVNLNGWVDDDDPQLVSKAVVGAVTLTADQIARADVDKDGAVTVLDAAKILRFLSSPNDPATFPACPKGFLGDANCDGKRDTSDAQLVLKVVGGLASWSVFCPPPAGSANLLASNIDKSTVLNGTDAKLILDCAAGLSSCLTQ